jgi:hypothetical protein
VDDREDILFCCFRVDCTGAGRSQIEGIGKHSSGELDTEISFRRRQKESKLCVSRFSWVSVLVSRQGLDILGE